MIGYISKRFSNKANEDIDEFIKDYKLYLMVANININNMDNKQKVLKLFQLYLTDKISR